MNGIDISQLQDFERDLINVANDIKGKESKKFIKKEGGKLNKENKHSLKSSGAATGSGITESKILASLKSGKAYKYNGSWSNRAYSSNPLTHLLEMGFIHKGGFKTKTGIETFIPGYHFMENAQERFENIFVEDCRDFVVEVFEGNGWR